MISKFSNSCYSKVAVHITVVGMFAAVAALHALPPGPPNELNDSPLPLYSPHVWVPYEEIPACLLHVASPDSGVFYEINVMGNLPIFGYPYHYSLIRGINDTLHAGISIYNQTDKDYDLTGTKYEQWFAPQVYAMEVGEPGGLAYRDSTELGYRARGWYRYQKRTVPVSVLKAKESGSTWLKLDIWDLPQGHFQICILPTDKVPGNVIPQLNGEVFEFYPARDLADSCNGYEGCFWRAWEDNDVQGMEKWTDEILAINPTSVSGWWLKAHYFLSKQDTLSAKGAFDNAIAYINSGADPAMPDSTKRPLKQAEKLYVRDTQVFLPHNRAQLGP